MSARRAVLVGAGAAIAAALVAVVWHRRCLRHSKRVTKQGQSKTTAGGLPDDSPNPFSLEDVPGLIVGGKVVWVGEQCWYRVQTGEPGRFFFVTASSDRGRTPLCDHRALAAALQLERVSGETVTVAPDALPLGGLVVRLRDSKGGIASTPSLELAFRAGGKDWQWTDGEGLSPGAMPAEDRGPVLRPGAKAVTKTKHTGAAVRLEIRNDSEAAARLFWLDGAGKRRDSGPLAAGGGVWTQSTYAGHAWVVAGTGDSGWFLGLETPDCGGLVVVTAALVAEATEAAARDKLGASDDGDSATSKGPAPVVSPNGLWEASVHQGNVVVRSRARCGRDTCAAREGDDASARLEGKFVALRTVDGEDGVNAFDARSLTWAPDSATLAAIKVAAPRVTSELHLVEAWPDEDCTARHTTRPYPRPGDPLPSPAAVLFRAPPPLDADERRREKVWVDRWARECGHDTNEFAGDTSAADEEEMTNEAARSFESFLADGSIHEASEALEVQRAFCASRAWERINVQGRLFPDPFPNSSYWLAQDDFKGVDLDLDWADPQAALNLDDDQDDHGEASVRSGEDSAEGSNRDTSSSEGRASPWLFVHYVERSRRVRRLVAVDVKTGSEAAVVEDDCSRNGWKFVDMCCGKFWRQWVEAPPSPSSSRHCGGGFDRELLHLSEVSGWCHLYLARWCRSDEGRDAGGRWEVAPVTRGVGWLVHRVVRVAGRRVWFVAGGLGLEASGGGAEEGEAAEEKEDPYRSHLCVVDIDDALEALARQAPAPLWRGATDQARAAPGVSPDVSPGVVVLTAVAGRGALVAGTHATRLSPRASVLVDVASRVDAGPVAVLRCAATGAVLCALEAADLAPLEAKGWVRPERFCAPGRDGATLIHGILLHPRTAAAASASGSLCPVLENCYAGPHGAHCPVEFGLLGSLQGFARRGFVVTMCDGMGTNKRGRAFLERCWQDLADSGLPDHRAFLLAARAERPWMDLGVNHGGRRAGVGIIGGSAGGQTAVRALLDHGDLYRVAVADCGCHDNRVDKVWWNEAFLGPPLWARRGSKAPPPATFTYAPGFLPGGSDLACSGVMPLRRAREACLRAAAEAWAEGGRAEDEVVGLTWRSDDPGAADCGADGVADGEADGEAPVQVWVKSAACGRTVQAAAGWHTLLLGHGDGGDAYERCSNVAAAGRLGDDAKLMLVVGERDDNVDPSSTIQLAGALQKHCKDFELVVAVGYGHGAADHCPFARRKRLKFLLAHLTP